MWRARFFQALPKLVNEYPTHRFIFLTLTVKNCELTELRSTLAGMNKAWTLLTKRKQFPAVGWVKSVEVTRNAKDNTAHPHFHAVLMVPAGYFKRGYLSQAKWAELWQKSLRVDYTPVVNVKAVKAPPGVQEDVLGAGLVRAVLETLKYGVKESDLVADPDWLHELTQQLHKTRAVAVGGVFKKYISEEEPEDLVHGEDEPDTELSENDPRFYFGWREKTRRYRLEEKR
jgi:plasmid rolling circle replication initiator protein Rep